MEAATGTAAEAARAARRAAPAAARPSVMAAARCALRLAARRGTSRPLASVALPALLFRHPCVPAAATTAPAAALQQAVGRRCYAAAAPGSLVYELKQLAKLHAEGGLTDEEYSAAKAAVISDKKGVYFSADAAADGAARIEAKVPTASAASLEEEVATAKKKLRAGNFETQGMQAVAMSGLTDEIKGESGLGQAMVHVAGQEGPRQMPGGGSGFNTSRKIHRTDDEAREQRAGAAAVLRARAAEAAAADAAAEGEVDEFDRLKAAELGGLTLTRDATPDPARSGAYFLRIACRMIGVPGKAMSEVSTNTAKRVLGECELPYELMAPDVSGECVIVITPPDTSEALVRSTMAAVIKSNGSATFGPELADPVMYRVLQI